MRGAAPFVSGPQQHRTRLPRDAALDFKRDQRSQNRLRGRAEIADDLIFGNRAGPQHGQDPEVQIPGRINGPRSARIRRAVAALGRGVLT